MLPVLIRFMYDAFKRELVDRIVPRRTLDVYNHNLHASVVSHHLIDAVKKRGARQDRKRHRSSDKCRGASRIYSYNIPAYSLQAVGRGHLHS